MTKPVILTPENTQPITELWAYVSCDEAGNEGICGGIVGGTNCQFVFGYERVAIMYEAVVKQIVASSGVQVRLVKFTTREEIRSYGGH